MWTYAVVEKAVIICKISLSFFEVSSNSGVSMRRIFLSSRVNTFESWTLAVRGSVSIPTGRFEPLARLMSWMQLGEFLAVSIEHSLQMSFQFQVRP